MLRLLRALECVRLGPTQLRRLSSTEFTESFAGVSESIHATSLENRAFVLDGGVCSALWLKELLPQVERVSAQLKRPPKLSVILVGDRPDSSLYVQRKREVCNKVSLTLFGIDQDLHS